MSDPTETVFVRGAGGTIYEMDVPAGGHARERFDQAFAKGELALVDVAHWVTHDDGSRHLVAGPEGGESPAPVEPAPVEPVEPVEPAPVEPAPVEPVAPSAAKKTAKG